MALSAAAPSEICVSKIPVLLNPVFIADLHLSNDKPATKEAFLKFLKTDAARFSELVILGDLFEFWAGDDMAEQYVDVISALKQYFSDGHRIYLMHGNRDFLLGADFAASIGAQILCDPIAVQIGREKVLLSHGDAWCTLDHDYQQFRSTLRDPAVQKQILKEELKYRVELANGLRSQSKADNQKKDAAYMDVVVSEVAKSLRSAGCKVVIHGHTHKPAHHTHVNEDSRFDRWVLPDWDFENSNQRGGYLSFENNYIHFGHLS